MAYPSIIILQLPLSDEAVLSSFVEACLRDGVKLVAVAGEGASDVEDHIDWLVVGDTDDDDRSLMTSAHHDRHGGLQASLDDAMVLCEQFVTEPTDRIQVVSL